MKGKHEKKRTPEYEVNWPQTLTDFILSVLAGLITLLIGKNLK